MSTILKALRKLEQDREEQCAGDNSPSAFRTRYAVKRAVRTTWFGNISMRWIRLLLLFTAGVAVAYMFFRLTVPTIHKETATAAKPNSSIASENNELATATEQSQNGLNQKTTNTSGQQTPVKKGVATSLEITAKAGLQQPATAQVVTEDRNNYPDDVLPAAKAAADIGRTKKTVTNEDAVENTTLTPAGSDTGGMYADVQRLTSGKLKIQAIAWSPEGPERMAVINSQVVHEGHTVEGFSVVSIEKDAVIVSNSGQVWKVAFGQP